MQDPHALTRKENFDGAIHYRPRDQEFNFIQKNALTADVIGRALDTMRERVHQSVKLGMLTGQPLEAALMKPFRPYPLSPYLLSTGSPEGWPWDRTCGHGAQGGQRSSMWWTGSGPAGTAQPIQHKTHVPEREQTHSALAWQIRLNRN